jgi:hypothetical protein
VVLACTAFAAGLLCPGVIALLGGMSFPAGRCAGGDRRRVPPHCQNGWR